MVSFAQFNERYGFLPVFGMIHLTGRPEEKVKRALEELKIYEAEGFSGVIVENYSGLEKDVVNTLEAISKKPHSIQIGINILPNDFTKAFEYAKRFGCSFIQLDYVAGNYVRTGKVVVGKTPHYLSLNETEYSKIREQNPDVTVIGGVHPKYYKPMPDSNLEKDLQDGAKRADAIAVTGAGTGKETPIEKITMFRKLLPEDKPLIVAAGLNVENVYKQLSIANGAIVGSYCKKDGVDINELDLKRTRDFMKEVKSTREYLIKQV